MHNWLPTFLCALFLLPVMAQTAQVEVLVADGRGKPVAGASVQLTRDQNPLKPAETNELGRVALNNVPLGTYAITVMKPGFEILNKPDIEVGAAGVTLQLTMIPLLARADSIEVRGTVAEVEENASAPNRLPAKKAKELPSRPATVADALPLTPGVVREPGGGLILSSSPENRSGLIVNSADVTDPATGTFGVTVPIDTVDVLNVYQTAYLAEYGRFTSGLVSVETKRGGDKWNWEINDPLPEFRIRSWQLRGLRTATPRLNFDGPIIPGKLFIVEGFEYAVRKTAVYTQPFPFNQKTQTGLNSFSQLDWVASSTHLLTGTVHIAPQRLGALNMDFFNPLAVTADASTHNYTGTVADRLTIRGGLLESRFSVTKFDADEWGKGDQEMIIAPAGNSGNYFADQNRTASRFSGAATYTFAPVERPGGAHHFKIGGYFAGSKNQGDLRARPINIVDNNQRLLTRIAFPRTRDFEITDVEKSVFGQDHWIITQRLAIDLGVRTEAQQISGAFRVAPRIGISITPFQNTGTVIRTGFGFFYDRVPLNVYAYNRYPPRLVTTYDGAGDITSGPTLYLPTLGQNRVRFPFVSQQPVDGNFSPRSNISSIQIEQPITRLLRLRATYLRNQSDGLIILNRIAPDPETGRGALLLEGTGESRYRQFDLTAQLRLRPDRELFFSYVRSRARGDLNEFGQFLGTVPIPIIRENRYGVLSTDLPNRFLSWGVVRLPKKIQIAPVIEYRSGFPYIETDAQQRYVGVPNSTRFPSFLSLDSRFSKDLQITAKYAIRLSVTGFNLTNHFNPEAVRSNTGDPAHGYFFGHRGRRFTIDFDFLF